MFEEFCLFNIVLYIDKYVHVHVKNDIYIYMYVQQKPQYVQ